MGAWVATVGVPPVCQERVLHGGSWPLWVLVFSSKAQGVGLRRKVGINTVPCLRFLQLWHFGPTGVSSVSGGTSSSAARRVMIPTGRTPRPLMGVPWPCPHCFEPWSLLGTGDTISSHTSGRVL